MTDRNEAPRLADLFELEPDAESLYRQAAALLRQLSAERDQLRAEVERLRAESVPLGAIRGIAVEAIRDVSGCPDLSKNGRHLSDALEETARHATYAAIDHARTTHKDGASA